MSYTIKEIKKKIDLIGSEGYVDGSSITKGHSYHVIPLAGFEEVPEHKTACFGEYETIRNLNNFKNKKVLEIGCANGYFSFNMAKEDARVTAYDHDDHVIAVNKMMQTLPEANGLSVKFINKRFGFEDLINRKYDITLMLNVHMWIDKQIGEENTRSLMRAISRHSLKIYFQTAHKESGGMQRISYLSSGKDIEEYLVECGFNYVREIKRSNAHGGIRIMYEAYGNANK